MKIIKKIRWVVLFVCVTSLGWQATAVAADIQWDPTIMSYTIPSDVNIYYVDSAITLTMDLTINGTFEVQTEEIFNFNLYKINYNNTFGLPGGIFNQASGDGCIASLTLSDTF